MATFGVRNYRQRLDESRVEGREPSRHRKVGVLIGSLTSGATIIGLSDLAFMLVFYGYAELLDRTFADSHFRLSESPLHMTVDAILGIALARRVSTSLERPIRCGGETKPRRWSDLWLVSLAVVLASTWGALAMRDRYSFCRMMADYHADADRWPAHAKDPAVHAESAKWYERAAIRPWFPVHPPEDSRRLD